MILDIQIKYMYTSSRVPVEMQSYHDFYTAHKGKRD